MNPKLLTIPTIKDPRGNLAVIEKEVLPFKVERVFYLFDVPSDAARGGHAHKQQSQVLIALSGSFEVVLKSKIHTQVYTLNKPDQGLFIPPGWWREMENFSSGAVCLVLASDVFDEADYLRDFDEFLLFQY